jgi:hypothetical protein
VRQVAGDRIAVRLGQQIDRAETAPAVGAATQRRDELQQSAARIVVDQVSHFGVDHGVDLPVEHARRQEVDRRQYQRDAGGEDENEEGGETRGRQPHARRWALFAAHSLRT